MTGRLTATMSEADLCAAFIAVATKPSRADQPRWIAYAETAGFDILLVRQSDGVQIGVEAKLALNPHVVAQSLPDRERWYSGQIGPDYRAVLVPRNKIQIHMGRLCAALGITVIGFCADTTERRSGLGSWFDPHLPREGYTTSADDWFEWLPAARCPVPDYMPDVAAGASSPIALTAWKIKAIRLLCLLEDGPVTRTDFKNLQISPTMWTGPRGWLDRTEAGWVAGERTPDLRRQHPLNFEQIRADKARWLVGPLLAARVALSADPRGSEA